MGCDIHLYVEKKANGVWEHAQNDCLINEDGYKFLDYKKSYYDGRNYNLFAILADVRNGSGFAGIKTGKGFNPISEPKGLPIDISKEIKEMSDQWDGDGHSHSWFTVRELIEYDWTQTTKLQGWINTVEYLEWSRWAKGKGESPNNYCGGISGKDIKHIKIEEMEEMINGIKNSLNSWKEWENKVKEYANVYCLAKWEMPYYKTAKEFLSNTLPRLFRLGSIDDVRIVFWFDN